MKYSAYYDTSGSESDKELPIVTVGLLATVARWIAVDQKWQRTLASHEVPYLHMRELLHSRGAFADWGADADRKDRLLNDLSSVLTGQISHAITVRVTPATLHAVDEQYRLFNDSCPSPYPFVTYRCIALMEEWIASHHSNAEFQHVVEHGDQGQGTMRQLANRGISHLIFAHAQDPTSKEYITPFQAADFFAYELRKWITNKLAGSREQSRKPFRVLWQSVGNVSANVMHRRDLIALCEGHPEAYPKRPSINASGVVT